MHIYTLKLVFIYLVIELFILFFILVLFNGAKHVSSCYHFC